ncbi:MAG: hypothetical protein ACR2MX_14110 [Cyclobacteriaceae bacterium]
MKKLFTAAIFVIGFALISCEDPSEEMFDEQDQKLENTGDFDLEA